MKGREEEFQTWHVPVIGGPKYGQLCAGVLFVVIQRSSFS